jgi:hypothetical protein
MAVHLLNAIHVRSTHERRNGHRHITVKRWPSERYSVDALGWRFSRDPSLSISAAGTEETIDRAGGLVGLLG